MARYCQALTAVGFAAGVALSGAAPLGAQQQTRTPDPNAPRLMVGTFRSAADKKQGVQLGDALRERLTRDLNVKQMWVLPRTDIMATLEASGFPTDEPLAPHDARALAQQLRADIYVVGNIARDSAGSGYVVSPQYVLARDNSLVQPLPAVRVGNPRDAAAPIANSFKQAHAQFAAERDCYRLAREQKYAEARAAAQRGIAAYPQATLSRICLANVMREQKATPDSVLAVVNQVLAIDPRSRPALTMAYETYRTANQGERASEALLRLVGADPSNTRLLEQVINEFAASGQAAKAIPFVEQLLRDNPGDPNFLNLAMRVRLAAKDYKGGIAAGEEMMRVDTATATPEVFTRLAAAAVVDSQPQKGAELAARGVAKFPTNAQLHVDYADILRSAGQTQQALAMLNKAVSINPRVPGVYTARARLQADANQPDSAIASLRQAVSSGDSAQNVARFALSIGQSESRKATASKAPADFARALSFLEFANTTNKSPEGSLLLGATSLQYGQVMLQDAQKNRSCPSARTAQQALTTAQAAIPEGGKANPQLATQLLGALGQLAPAGDQVARAVCR
jgi:tetratricopeptide (TPR) repeat protein